MVFDGKRITGGLNILDVKLGGFFDILERFLAGVALRDATRETGNYGNVASVTFALQD